MPDSVLLVDDEENQRRGLAKILQSWGFTVQEAGSVGEAIESVRNSPPSVIITDLVMPGEGGMDLLRAIRPGYIGPVIVLTAHGTIAKAVEAWHAGAEDFVEKPVNLPELKVRLKRARDNAEMIAENRRLREETARQREELARQREELARHGTFGPLRGNSAPMREVYRLIRQVAPSTISVLIAGESGTGKELVARTIHDRSPRRDKPFVAINCAAIPRELIESELFGHEKGAFTGAIARKSGCFEMADGGTLFLDEIAEMEEAVQAKLLRVLQEQTFRRIGGAETISSDVRVLAATNRDPRQAIAERRLREDLYYRLNVVAIELPPLRDRVEDVRHLARQFLDESGKQQGRQGITITAETLSILERYPWPGNVRELKNAIDRAVVLGTGSELSAQHLPPEVLMGGAAPVTAAAAPNNNGGGKRGKPEPGGQFSIRLGSSVEEVERELITRTLSSVGGNKTRAARILGLSLKTIHNKARKYGL
jgi:DNA-binding NtrC family response regulator